MAERGSDVTSTFTLSEAHTKDFYRWSCVLPQTPPPSGSESDDKGMKLGLGFKGLKQVQNHGRDSTSIICKQTHSEINDQVFV